MDFVKLKARYDETRQYKDRWIALYKDLYLYVIPDRDAFNIKWNYRDDGKPVTNQVWDNTAVLGAYQRANDLHGLMMPKDRVWGSFELDPHKYSKQAIAAQKPLLDEMNDNIFFYLNQSNLNRVVSSSNLDLVGGTGALWVESIDDETPLYFRSIPAVTLYIEYSTDDVLNTCWYQCKMSGRQVRDNFPGYRGERLGALIEAPNDMFIVIYGQIKMAENKFYLYATLEDDPFTPLWETDRRYQQIIIYRDRVRPGESDGRGIGIDLLPTIRDLNKMVSYRTLNMDYKIHPPMFYDADSYFNPYSVRQWAGMMVARNTQGRNPLEALQMPEYPDTFEVIKDLREFIQKGFMIDPLGEVEAPVKSATEVSIRENRAQRTASVDISRLINELPKQVFEVAAQILSDRRLLSRDRKMALTVTPSKLKFVFESPLFDLQKQDNINHFVTNLQIKQQFFGQGAAVGTCNLPAVNRFLTESLNLESDLFVTDQQLQDFLKNAAQAQQQAALPTPSTSATQVPLPQTGGVGI